MTTEDALLAAVLAAPDDDLPRLVYADRLDENGQPERAEFIRVQLRIAELRDGCSCGECVGMRGGGQHTNGGCAVGRDRVEMPDGSSRRSFVRERQAKLLDEYAYLWFPPPLVACLSNTGTLFKTATPGMIAAHITRGFVSEVHCTLAEWCGPRCVCRTAGGPWENCSCCNGTGVRAGIGPQIVRRHPVTKLVLTNREPHENPAGVFVFNRVDGEPDHQSELPAFIFDMMEGGSAERPTSRTHTVKFYATREYADKALSEALIAWAKAQPHPARIHTSPVSVDVTA